MSRVLPDGTLPGVRGKLPSGIPKSFCGSRKVCGSEKIVSLVQNTSDNMQGTDRGFFVEMILLYIIVSIIGIIINFLVIIAYGRSYISLALYILTTLLYIPLFFYFYRKREYNRIRQIVTFTIVFTVAYIVIEGFVAGYSIATARR